VRIVVLYSAVCNSLAVVIKESYDNGIHLDNVLLLLDRIEVCYLLSESSLCVYGVNKRNTEVLAGPVVVLTKCGSGMNYTNTLVGADVIGSNDSERTFSGLVREIWEERLVAISNKLSSLYCFDYLGLIAEYLFEVGKCCLASNENSVLELNARIIKLLTYCKTEIRRKSPRCGCSLEDFNVLACLGELALELNDYPSILSWTSGV
jgi:hypothetical protein